MSNQSLIPSDVQALVEEGRAALLPVRSRQHYDKAREQFISWCSAKEIKPGQFSEDIVLAYIVELSFRYAPSSLWTTFSMLRKSLLAHDGFSLGDAPQIVAFLKQKNNNHSVKKSNLFVRSQIEEFLDNAPNADYLHIKVAAQFALFGACRKSELTALEVGDVTDAIDHLLVKIRQSKTGPRSFVLVGSNNAHRDILANYRIYCRSRPIDAPARLFLGYRGGKCTKQPIGKNTLGSFPRKIAEFLKLPECEKFTSHAFRRSAATWMADGGVDLINLKRFGGWTSDSVAQSYIGESVGNKRKLAVVLQNEHTESTSYSLDAKIAKTTNSVLPSIDIKMCNNCTFNINISK